MVKVTMKTKFMNSKRRAIFESTGKQGKKVYFSMGEDGTRRYGPKARFHQNAEGKVHTVKANNVVPTKLRLASLNAARKERSNKGAARGPREGALLRAMNTESRKMAAAGPKVRKERSNKGAARKKPAPMNFRAALLKPTGPKVRKERSNKGVKRGPRKAKALTPLTAGAQMLLKMNAQKRRPVTRSMTKA